jgi:hypothetical protein
LFSTPGTSIRFENPGLTYLEVSSQERGTVKFQRKVQIKVSKKSAGEKSQLLCGFFLNFSLFGTGVVYTLTSATSMRYIHTTSIKFISH